MQVFLTTPWIPPEWVKAHGHEPRGVWWLPTLGLEQSATGAGICAFAHSVCALAEARPESAVVFSTHCDQLRRGFDSIACSTHTLLFNLPATWQTASARHMFASELGRLAEFLVALGGVKPDADSLHRAIAAYDSARVRLIEAAAHVHGRAYSELVAGFHWNGSVPIPNVSTTTPEGRSDNGLGRADRSLTPVALVGGPLPRSHWELLDVVESFGGQVVLNGTEAGERSLGIYPPESWDVDAHERPEQMLARRSLARCVDMFQRPNSPLYSWLADRLLSRKVRGILLWQFAGCDLWRAEARGLKQAFGLPILLLEPEPTGGVSARMVGRVQTFMETLR